MLALNRAKKQNKNFLRFLNESQNVRRIKQTSCRLLVEFATAQKQFMIVAKNWLFELPNKAISQSM